jgi:hypothetical protein
MLDAILEWADQLVVASVQHMPQAVRKNYVHNLPQDVVRIDCIRDMCAIHKGP